MAASMRLLNFGRSPFILFQIHQKIMVNSAIFKVRCNTDSVCRTVVKSKSLNNHHGTSDDHHRNRFDEPDSCSPGLVFPLLAFFGIKKAVEPETHKRKDDDIVLCIKHAKLAERKGDYGQASHFYHQALSNVTDHEKRKDMTESEILDARVHIYDNMANLQLSQGHFNQAETLYKETMRGLIEKNVQRTDNSIVEISLKLSMIYAMQGKHVDAEKGYIFCIDTMKAKVDEVDKIDTDTFGLYGMCLNSYSRFLMLRERLEEAEAYMNKCVQVGKTTFGDSHPQVAVLLNDLASMQTFLKKYQSAAETIDQAIYIAENTASHDLPSLYCNKGEILIHMNKLEEAKKVCKLALEMAEKFGDREAHSKAQQCINNCD